jgi:hypothetical protein
MKSILAAVILIFSSNAFAQVVSVNVFEPLAGKTGLEIEYFREAKDILQTAGAGVTISRDLSGTLRFASIFESWEAFGTWSDSLATNPVWAAFQRKTAQNPAAIQTENILFNIAVTSGLGAPGSVTQVTVWEVTTGTMSALVEGARGAKPIHEKAGSVVAVLTTGQNTMYYLQRYENMAAWGKDRGTPNPEFNAYMQSLGAANNGDLGAVIVDQFTMTEL